MDLGLKGKVALVFGGYFWVEQPYFCFKPFFYPVVQYVANWWRIRQCVGHYPHVGSSDIHPRFYEGPGFGRKCHIYRQ